MKAIIISASVLEGVSVKKNPNGTSYEIASVKYLKKIEDFENRDGIKHTKMTGYGYEVKEHESFCTLVSPYGYRNAARSDKQFI